MSKKAFWWGYLTGIVLSIGGIWLHSYLVEAQATPEISLPTLSVTDLYGERIDVTTFADTPFVLNFWATWCKPCIEEFPHFEKAKSQFGDKIVLVMISDEPMEKIIAFKEKNPYSFIFLRSTRPLSHYGIISRPVTYFYDAAGNIAEKVDGGLDEDEITNYIDDVQ